MEVKGNYSVEVLADSIGPAGVRLTTIEATLPRYILAELNTHRALSRNSASSRAIPVAKQIDKVMSSPVIPSFAMNQRGMQAGEALAADAQSEAESLWLDARARSAEAAAALNRIGVHKQWTNRLLEPFMWHTVIITATDWDNMFALRCHSDAQPEFQRISCMMRDAMDASEPKHMERGYWHLPLVYPEPDQDVPRELWPHLSAGRCARVSYLTHDGRRDPQADLELCYRLLVAGHMSPMEHPAEAQHLPMQHGNLRGWRQLRKFIPGESNWANKHTSMKETQ